MKRSLAVAIVMTAMVATACGNRSSDAAIQKLLAGSELDGSVPRDAAVATGAAPEGASVANPSASPSSGVDSPLSSPAAGQSTGARTDRSTPKTAPTSIGAAPSAGGATSKPGGASSNPGGATSNPGGANSNPGGATSNPGEATSNPGGAIPNPGGATKRSPVVIASVGTYSGPVGAVLLPSVRVVQAWTASINNKGGLNGHPVQLLVYDDGMDPARHRAQVQEAIEQRRVIAFVQNGEGLTGRPSVDYVTSKRVPVVGSETAADFFYDSPMYFPQASAGVQYYHLWEAGVAEQVLPSKSKLGTLFCVEAQTCDEAEQHWAKEAAGLGFTHVYRGRVSFTQPDFTAECLAARNNGAQVLVTALDPASIVRLANACARQGYRPVLSTPISATPSQKVLDDEPNLDGMVTPTNVFPFFQRGTPASEEFRSVMATYAPKETHSVATATGWVSAKLFEKAGANMPEPPTAEAILQGLWTLRADTLNGLTAPLTFVANQTATRTTCWWPMVAKERVWTSPDGFKLHCK